MQRQISVRAIRDPEAGVWFTQSDDVPGLCIEADSLEALMARAVLAIEDLMNATGDEGVDLQDVQVCFATFHNARIRKGSLAAA